MNLFSKPPEPSYEGAKAESLGGQQKKSSKWKWIMALLLFAAVYLAGYIATIKIYISNGELFNIFKCPQWKIIAVGITTPEGLSILPFTVIGALFLFFLFSRTKDMSRIKSTDERGVDYSTVSTYGSAEWMSEEEAKTCYEIAPIDKTKGIILAQYVDDEEQVENPLRESIMRSLRPIYAKMGKEETRQLRKGDGDMCISLPGKPGANNNICVFGSPGTGKSFCFVRNAIYQAIKRGESVVVTDPKGELYESSSEILKANGYNVKVFNLLTPTQSDAWDCAGEIFDPVTGNVDETRVADFATILMKNTSDGPEDGFWAPGENNLLKAVIFYRAYIHETSLIATYSKTANKHLFPKINLDPEDEKKIRDILEGKDAHMVTREEAFRWLAVSVFDGDVDKADAYVAETKSHAEPCTITDIYYELITNDIQAFESKFAQIPVSHPASIAWGIFKNSSPNTQPGFVTGLAQKLQLFQMRDVRRITANQDINLSDISAEKTALFVIISDKSTAMRPISSLLFNFIFKDISDVADKSEKGSRLPVNVICDEFANLGRMPQFEVVISTVRSRCINISIILQSVTQLNKVYSIEDANTIIACCDTILFIGCNDVETANFISSLSGVSSIRVTSYKDSQSASQSIALSQTYQVSDGDGKRNLMNPDEVRRLPAEQVLLYHRGNNMLKANRCGYICHPFYKQHYAPGAPDPLETRRLKDYPLAAKKYEISESLDAFLAGDANNVSSQAKSYEDSVTTEKSSEDSFRDSPKQIDADDTYGNRRPHRVTQQVRNAVPKSSNSSSNASSSSSRKNSNSFGM